MQRYTYIYWIHTDAMNNRRNDNDRRRKTSLTIFTSHFIARVRKGCSRFACERELEIEHNCNILTSTFMAVNVVSFSFFWCSTGALGSTLLGDGFLYCILSASSLDPNSAGPQTPSAWCSFPYHISTPTVCNSTVSSNSTELYNRSTPTRSLKSNV